MVSSCLLGVEVGGSVLHLKFKIVNIVIEVSLQGSVLLVHFDPGAVAWEESQTSFSQP